jgi:hypothetical protein
VGKGLMKGERSRFWRRGELSIPSANAELRFILYKYDAMPQKYVYLTKISTSKKSIMDRKWSGIWGVGLTDVHDVQSSV